MRKVLVFGVILLCLFTVVPALHAQTTIPIPKVTFGIGTATKPQDVAVTLQILFFMTILSLAPAILIMTTAFPRIIIALYFLKQALGTQSMPPSQLLIGLALFLTFFVMAPTWSKVNDTAFQPYLKNKITLDSAYAVGIKPIRDFMLRQTREKDLAMMVHLAHLKRPNTPDDIPTYVVIPAFAISEMRIGFEIGFLIFIPFMMIDMIVASVLMSMGMMMVPPMMISLPMKILLFVLVDGWYLLVGSLVQGFR
ncbi:MAG: flagellar type III secretion system pore protein FliP [Bacteroidetes bacterium]|nr:flagellar type III secretion system pore protein FliP [Bacteroidota bacterium]